MRRVRPSLRGRACVLGLDLSLRGAAGLLLPLDWNCDFRQARWTTAGESLARGASQRRRHERCAAIADAVLDLVDEEGADLRAVFVEDYAYSRPDGAHQLGELRAVVRGALFDEFRSRIEITPINQASARSLFFGHVPKLPKELLKAAIVDSLRRCGATFDDHDVADAFLAANAGLAEMGVPAITLV